MSSDKKISVEELSKHASETDLWTVINGKVWDMTDFAPTHPGGLSIIFEYAGGDSTKAYNEIHSPSLVSKTLGSYALKGILDESTITEEWKSKQVANKEHQSNPNAKPELSQILNSYDFERAAEKSVSAKSWAYYSGAANDNLTLAANHTYYQRIFFRPRVMVGVANPDTSVNIFGHKFSCPIFSSPCGMAKLSHPEGELAMVRAAHSRGTTIVACNNASFSFAEIREQIPKDYPLFYQLYVNKDRKATEKLMREVSALNPTGIMVTVDLPVVGKREADERVQLDAGYKAASHQAVQTVAGDKKGSGLARSTGGFIDPALNWKDIAWLKTLTNAPIFAKGIQCAADARLALAHGCAGIYISNHGGRAVDTAQPSILTLLEIQANCPEVLEQMEVFIDGGVRRGADVLKAICLGASGVCLGRPFLYATTYGEDGAAHLIDILKDELETAMQQTGIRSLDQAHPGLLNTAELDRYVYRGDQHPYARKIVRRQKSKL
ncbi:hypothetical protein H2198_010085 [Neophaeococcomyces mojaviensis]|uniref:Uncharacterized protein n=1 Tax=Neophaeococcomyces mojaviensis TaxID=3383035 RepID=A0ACC2ZSK3_9EURO|nr:hypothetical protein H2198_010085 [Knufia sp. JES_112]